MKYKVWYYVFLLILISPFVLSIFFNDIDNQGENRNLSEKPVFSISTVNSFSEEYESYFNDHIPFRNIIININSKIKYFCFHDSPNNNVVIGKNNWLYLKKGEIDSYKKINVYNEKTLAAAADYFNVVSEYCADNGAELIIFIPPDKASIYPENVPDYVKVFSNSKNRAEVFSEYINKNTNVKVIYPKSELLEAKAMIKEDIYYTYDSHWNQIGAYVGTKALVKEMGITLPNLSDLTIMQNDNIDYSLAGMLGIKELVTNEKDYEILGFNGQSEPSISYVDDGRGNNVVTSSETPKSNKQTLILRDSFFTAMEPYISTCFKYIHAPHYELHYNPKMIEEEKPDYVVIEIVERALDTFTYLDIIPPDKVGVSPWDRFFPDVNSILYDDNIM